MDWWIIVSIVMSILGAIWGVKTHIAKLVKETGEVLTVLGKALEDGEITKKEAVEILKEAQDVVEAFGLLMSKIKK